MSLALTKALQAIKSLYHALPESTRDACVTSMHDFLDNIRKSMCPPSISAFAEFVFKGTDVYVKSDPQAAPVKISGNKGKLLLIALLEHAAGRLLLELYGYTCRDRTNLNRLGKDASAIKQRFQEIAPGLKLSIEKVRDSQSQLKPAAGRPLGSYDLKWSRNAKVISPPHRASGIVTEATAQYREDDFEGAYFKGADAVATCSVYFPAYQVCLDCLVSDPQLITKRQVQERGQSILHASTVLQQWLEALNDIDLASIPSEFHEDVNKHLIAENTARIDKLRELRDRICGSVPQQISATWHNPANQLLWKRREGHLNTDSDLFCFHSKRDRLDFRRVLDATKVYISESEYYIRAVNNQNLDGAEQLIADHTILQALFHIADEEKHYFAEPNNPQTLKKRALDKNTVNLTAIILGKQVIKLHFG